MTDVDSQHEPVIAVGLIDSGRSVSVRFRGEYRSRVTAAGSVCRSGARVGTNSSRVAVGTARDATRAPRREVAGQALIAGDTDRGNHALGRG